MDGVQFCYRDLNRFGHLYYNFCPPGITSFKGTIPDPDKRTILSKILYEMLERCTETTPAPAYFIGDLLAGKWVIQWTDCLILKSEACTGLSLELNSVDPLDSLGIQNGKTGHSIAEIGTVGEKDHVLRASNVNHILQELEANILYQGIKRKDGIS